MERHRRLEIDDQDSCLDETVFASDLVKVGRFRCPVTYPRFGDTGPTSNYCFVFPRKPVWIQHEGDRAFVADPTVVTLYNPGHPYRRWAIDSDGDHGDWFGVAPTLLRETLAVYDPDTAEHESRLFRVGFTRGITSTYFAQRQLFRYVTHTGAPDTLAVEESVIGLLTDVLENVYATQASAPQIDGRHREVVEKTRAYLGRTYALNQGLINIAGAVGTSVFHLCRLFRRQTTLTLHRYRTELRLRRSLEWVSDLDSDLLAIAVELGYSSHSHFTHAFHQAFGVTPSAFRAESTRARIRLATASLGQPPS